jgi:uncharacterized protein YcfL
MKKNLKIGLAVALVLVMSLAVAGCTSNTSTSNSGSANLSKALTLNATQIPANDTVTAYYGSGVVAINATLSNNNAGTFKVSSDNFYLADSSGATHSPLNSVTTAVSDSGYDTWMHLYFTVAAGTTPSTLRYYDGNFDVSCTVTT